MLHVLIPPAIILQTKFVGDIVWSDAHVTETGDNGGANDRVSCNGALSESFLMTFEPKIAIMVVTRSQRKSEPRTLGLHSFNSQIVGM